MHDGGGTGWEFRASSHSTTVSGVSLSEVQRIPLNATTGMYKYVRWGKLRAQGGEAYDRDCTSNLTESFTDK